VLCRLPPCWGLAAHTYLELPTAAWSNFCLHLEMVGEKTLPEEAPVKTHQGDGMRSWAGLPQVALA